MGFSISFVQLIIMAVWVFFALWIFSTCNQAWARWAWAVFAIIVFLLFAVIAFFNISELSLLAFIAKKIKDWFLDVSKKFQINYTKDDPTEITIARSKQEKWKQRIEIKEDLDLDKLSQIEKWGIL